MTMLISFFLWCGAASAAPAYTLDDLQALERQQAWHELWRHLDDVAPAQRTETWQGLLERSALGHLQELDADAATALALDAPLRFDALKRSKPFMARRASVGLAGLASCVLRGADGCADRFASLWALDPSNAELALGAARLLAKGKAPQTAAPLWARAVAAGRRECSDEGLERSVLTALGAPAGDPLISPAQELASGACWPTLKEPLVDRFINGSAAYRSNTCALLKAKGALSPLSSKQCP